MSTEIKKMVALHATELVKQNMTIGLGSGSTIYWFIIALGGLYKTGLAFTIVPTSKHTEELATQNGIPVISLDEVDSIDITIDGADEIDPQLQLIKGGGGALLQEKLVAVASERMVVIADQSKLVPVLGAFPLPVEIVPYGWKKVQEQIEQMYKIKTSLRHKQDQPFVTDHQHYILDCHFESIPDPFSLNGELNLVPGVVETGLFLDIADTAFIGYENGTIDRLYK